MLEHYLKGMLSAQQPSDGHAQDKLRSSCPRNLRHFVAPRGETFAETRKSESRACTPIMYCTLYTHGCHEHVGSSSWVKALWIDNVDVLQLIWLEG